VPAAGIVGPYPEDLAAWASYLATSTCDALRRRGVPVARPGSTTAGSRDAFTITLDRLGPTFTLLVSYEAPLGTTRRALWAPMNDLHEAGDVIERFVTELTSRVRPVVHPPPPTLASALPEPKPRKVPDRPKQLQWYFGLDGGLVFFPAARESPVAELFGAFFSVEAGRWGFALRGAFGVGFAESEMRRLSFDFRYYVSRSTTSLFVGAGPTSISMTEKGGMDTVTTTESCFLFCSPSSSPETDTFNGKLEGSGPGAFAEVGFMFRRLRKIPLALTFRADFPFQTLTRTTPDYFVASRMTLSRTGPTSVYEVPLALVFSVGF
jgi:hypothetical protein